MNHPIAFALFAAFAFHHSGNHFSLQPLAFRIGVVTDRLTPQRRSWNMSRIKGKNTKPDCFDEGHRRFTAETFPIPQEGLVLWQLYASCHSTAESALILVANLRLWDAEVLVRSIVEGTLKFTHLLMGSEDGRRQKFQEFSVDLADIARIKKHQRLTELFSVLDNPAADEWKSFRDLLLSESALAELRTKYRPRVMNQHPSLLYSEPTLSTLPPSKSHRANESPAAAF